MQSIKKMSKVSTRCCDVCRTLSNLAKSRKSYISFRDFDRNRVFSSMTNNCTTVLPNNLRSIGIGPYPVRCYGMHAVPLSRTIERETRSLHSRNTRNEKFIDEIPNGKKDQRIKNVTFKNSDNEKIQNDSSKASNSLHPKNAINSMIPKQGNQLNGENARRDYGKTAATTISQKMPEPRGIPFLGTTLSLIYSGGAAKLHEYVDVRHKELGPVYRESIGPVKAVFISSPDEFRKVFRLEGSRPKHLLPEAWMLYNEIRGCQRGLFFMEGDEWLQFRRIMNKLLLRPESADFMVGPCREAAEDLVKNWQCYAKQGNYIPELEGQLYQWSIEVMLATLLGSIWPKYRKNLLLKSDNLARSLHKIFEYSAQLSLWPVKWAMNLKLPAWRKFVASVDDAMAIVRKLVYEMEQLEGDGLIRMLAAEGVAGDDLIRIVADLILAAGDTTAYSTQWALFLLGSHPSLQDELFESLKSLDQGDVSQEPLLKGVLKEALRLYPTAPFLTRFLPEDSIVGGYHVSEGELLLLSLYSSGRDSENFTEPNRFRPERWIRTERGDYNGVINPHATLPFALGARSCVGRKIAETQMTFTLAKLVENFKMECTNKDRVKMILQLVSVPSEPILLRLASRR